MFETRAIVISTSDPLFQPITFSDAKYLAAGTSSGLRLVKEMSSRDQEGFLEERINLVSSTQHDVGIKMKVSAKIKGLRKNSD